MARTVDRPTGPSSRRFLRRVMGRGEQAVFVFLVGAAVAFTARYALWWFRPEHVPANWRTLGPIAQPLNIAYFALLSVIVWRGLLEHAFHWWLVPSMARPIPFPPPPGLRVALMTCFVPGKEPLDLLERSLRAMVQVRYPHDTWVLDEGDDPAVRALCQRLGVRHFSRHGIPEFNQPRGPFLARTKAGNHNAWHHLHGDEYDAVAQMDMDYLCKPDLLEKTLGYFRIPRVAFVGGPQIYGNVGDSFIARGSAEQAYGFYCALQMATAGQGFQLFIGTVHVIRTAALRSIGGYAPHIVEDHLTGMRLYAAGWQSIYVPEVLAVGEGPTTWSAYFAQQMRWAYGSLDILLRHMPRHWWRLPWRANIGYPLFEAFYLFGAVQFLGVLLTTLYFALGWNAASMDLGTWVRYAYPPFALAWTIHYWLQRYNLREEEGGVQIAAHVLMQAAWPVTALAFLQALVGRKLQYAVTPKGSAASRTERFPFALHLVMVALVAVGLAALPLTGHWAAHLGAWAIFNALTLSLLALGWPAGQWRARRHAQAQA
ncbi:MAG: glycosyltransferase family 2 protein, partial [Thermomicrobiales bacterium]